ncbi:MAG: hypothetical protein RL189_95 [Pseudomonadota bacterium]|jgi:murein DD-endopeptidase MepM/ murein hydrolase activator NlpD
MKIHKYMMMFVSLTPALTLLAACKQMARETSTVSSLDAPGLQVSELLTANENTTLKSSLMQSSTLGTDQICPIPQGTILTAGSIKPEGIEHWRVFKITEVKLPSGEVGRTGSAAVSAEQPSAEAVKTPSEKPTAETVKTPAELLSCDLLNKDSILVFSPHFSRQKEQRTQSPSPDQVRETDSGDDSAYAWPTRGRKIRNDSGGSGHFNAPRASGRGHQGIDIVAAVGEPVYATRSGSIVDPSYEYSYGKVLDVNHGDGYSSRYAHLTSFSYSLGAYVEKGQRIATAGRTGNASGPSITPHLHFEIRRNGSVINPLSKLP